ncbi:response regulator [Deinococcus aerophilus]|uniref:Transcriptional regulator n=1 Tax=Deinococcus aerophilus TaxID=522488 RepID=A0ABQ2GKE1_9DEIO|nr:response regulator [Deinococcus aerophilus]GGL98815.1 transcriptional regulator [Deinococcus aerophilus]
MPQIFIVDDSISVRKALEITFKRHSLGSFSAVSGEQALETLEGRPTVDLLMADVIMPGMSGLELCRAVRRDPQFQHLPVVLMSGNIDEDIRRQAREVGANGVLRKPFSPEELIPMVEELLAAVPVAAAPAEPSGAEAEPHAPTPTHLPDGFAQLVAEARQRADVEAVLVLDAQFSVVAGDEPTSELAAQWPMYIRFFMTTAQVVGQALLGDELQAVTLSYAGRQVTFQVQQGHTVVTLNRREKTLN